MGVMGYDAKYGKVTTEHGDIPDDEIVMVFRGRDRLLPSVLNIYLELCDVAGCPDRHVDLVAHAYDLVCTWQRDHPDRIRTPDSESSRAWLKEDDV